MCAVLLSVAGCSDSDATASSDLRSTIDTQQQLAESCETTKTTLYGLRDKISAATAAMSSAADSLSVSHSPSDADKKAYKKIADQSGAIVDELRAVVPKLSSPVVSQALTEYVTPFGVLSDYFLAMSSDKPELPADETIQSASAAIVDAQSALAMLCGLGK